MARSPRFQPPPPRTVHAVLPHTAHRRRSPAAFGFPRQSRKGLGATTIPDKVTSPSRLGEANATDPPPEREAAAVALADEAFQPHPRVFADLAEAGRGVAVPEDRRPSRPGTGSGPPRSTPAPSAAGTGPLVCRIRSRACCMALSAGQRARKTTPAFPGGPLRPHQAVVEAEEVNPLAPFLQVPGRRRELPPPPPTDLGVNLSIHPARAVQLTSHAGSRPGSSRSVPPGWLTLRFPASGQLLRACSAGSSARTGRVAVAGLPAATPARVVSCP